MREIDKPEALIPVGQSDRQKAEQEKKSHAQQEQSNKVEKVKDGIIQRDGRWETVLPVKQ